MASQATTRMSNMRTGARSEPARDGRRTGVYRRRRPERTVLYQVVQHNLESWLAQLRETDPDNDPIPWYVEQAGIVPDNPLHSRHCTKRLKAACPKKPCRGRAGQRGRALLASFPRAPDDRH